MNARLVVLLGVLICSLQRLPSKPASASADRIAAEVVAGKSTNVVKKCRRVDGV